MGFIYLLLITLDQNKIKLSLALSSIGLFLLAFFTKPISLLYLIPAGFLPMLYLEKLKASKLKLSTFFLILTTAFGLSYLLYQPLAAYFGGYLADHSLLGDGMILNLKRNLYRSWWWMTAYTPITIILASTLALPLIIIKHQIKRLGHFRIVFFSLDVKWLWT